MVAHAQPRQWEFIGPCTVFNDCNFCSWFYSCTMLKSVRMKHLRTVCLVRKFDFMKTVSFKRSVEHDTAVHIVMSTRILFFFPHIAKCSATFTWKTFKVTQSTDRRKTSFIRRSIMNFTETKIIDLPWWQCFFIFLILFSVLKVL